MVNTYALVRLEGKMTPGLQSGYITDTLLDPHAANNSVPGGHYSIRDGILGPIAKSIIDNYQGRADDPPVFIPAVVDNAQVFFEHTAATSSQSYNLWGQVPVKSDGPLVHYYNLSPSKATHTGKTGIQFWYRNNIVPSLGNQAPLVQELELNAQIDHGQMISSDSAGRNVGPAQLVNTSEPEFSGTATPGAMVKLSLSPATEPWVHVTAGTTHADDTGQWSLNPSRPLRDGQYRVIVSAFSRALRTRPGLAVVPMQPLGRMIVDTSAG